MRNLRRLVAYYDEWRVLSESEGGAICAGKWSEVAARQAQKNKLQDRIIEATTALRAEAARHGIDWVHLETQFRTTVDALVGLEERNRGWLLIRWRAALNERENVVQVSHNLRRIAGVYASPSRSCWYGYS
jgi:hypothetical protein